MKQRVLIIVENLPVPFDSRVWKEAIALHQANYDVTVLCPKGKGFEKGYEKLDGIHIYRHPLPKEGSGALSYLWEYTWALFFEFVYSVWIYFRRGFEAIQACNPPDNIFLVAVPFKLLGVRFIFDHHDINPELYFSKYERYDFFYKTLAFLEKLTFRCSDIVLSTNNSYREIAISRGGLEPDNVFVVRNGPDLNAFRLVSPNPELKRGRKYLVGYVGTISIQEGLDLLIDVAEYLKRRGREDLFFMCVGGGPGLAGLQKAVKERELSDMITFTGRIPDSDLLEILSTADVCVNPDKPCEMNDLSTMIKIMEYMALSKPIVQFDLKEGKFSAQESSLYCSHENRVADFAEKILWLLDHPEERRRMGEFGQRRVRTELAWEFSVPNLLAAYEKAFRRLKGRHPIQTESIESSTNLSNG
jgi:glycosyltransferase involved in cell wall biosynthesis